MVFDRWTPYHRFAATRSLERVDHSPPCRPILHPLLDWIQSYQCRLVNEILVVAVYERNFGVVRNPLPDRVHRHCPHRDDDVRRRYCGIHSRHRHHFYLMSWPNGPGLYVRLVRKEAPYNERRGANDTARCLIQWETINICNLPPLTHIPLYPPRTRLDVWVCVQTTAAIEMMLYAVCCPSHHICKGSLTALNGFASPCYPQRMYENLCRHLFPRSMSAVCIHLPAAFLFWEHDTLRHS